MKNRFRFATRFRMMVMGLAAVPFCSALAAAPPAITSVTFTTKAGVLNAVLHGKSFGAKPAGVPCNSGAISQFGLTATKNIFSSLTYNITAWTNAKITLTGITGANPGDAVFADVKNDALQNVATWGGNIPGGSGNPVIKSVAFSGSGKNLKITITGSGFGPAPSGVPGTGNTAYLNFVQYNIVSPGQDNYPWGAGWQAQGIADTTTLKYQSWTDKRIEITGFAGAYGTDGFVNEKGDPYFIWLWTPPGQNPGSTGPQTAIGGRLP